MYQFTWTFHAHYGIGILCVVGERRRQHVRENIEKEKVGWVGQSDTNRSMGCDVINRHTYSIYVYILHTYITCHSILSKAIYEVSLPKKKTNIYCVCGICEAWLMATVWIIRQVSVRIRSVAAIWCHCAKINKFDAIWHFRGIFQSQNLANICLNVLNECNRLEWYAI